jgi:hypothetical protein
MAPLGRWIAGEASMRLSFPPAAKTQSLKFWSSSLLAVRASKRQTVLVSRIIGDTIGG